MISIWGNPQRCIQNSVKYLRWNYFSRNLHLRCLTRFRVRFRPLLFHSHIYCQLVFGFMIEYFFYISDRMFVFMILLSLFLYLGRSRRLGKNLIPNGITISPRWYWLFANPFLVFLKCLLQFIMRRKRDFKIIISLLLLELFYFLEGNSFFDFSFFVIKIWKLFLRDYYESTD